MIAEVSSTHGNLCDVNGWISSFARDARVVDPLCPRCGGAMNLKRGALGRLFWGCSSFPRCRGKRDGRDLLLQQRQWQAS
ncbi:MAG: topoisomerase DNA-binding C4 zinc finger domain-containing protein [Chthoniobacterales bacterium]